MIILDPVSPYAAGVFVSSNVPETDHAPHSLTAVYAAGDRVMDVAAHLIYESKVGVRAPVTISIASPGVVNWAAHGLAAGTPVAFSTTGALPSGIVAGTAYYVLAPATNTFTLSATVGGAAIGTSGSQSGVHTGSASQNFNRALTDGTYWLKSTATNRWRMLDDYNNTQTEMAEAIIIELKPSAIAQGLYLGNLDAAEVALTATDPDAGVVYSETTSLTVSNSKSSFYGWLFNRIRRRKQFCNLSLPLYYNQTVKIEIRKPGGIAKCGMCNIGPLEDVGLSQYGIAADIKDYSTTKFNIDGTSETTKRGFAKRMSIDVELPNDVVDSVHERLLDFRQKTVVFIGAKQFDLSLLCGVYESFKTVIEDYPKSKISLQINARV